jgi:amino acid adenylation domain-containing protein
LEEINDRLAGLSPEKRRLLETMLRQKKVAAAAATTIPRREPRPEGQESGPFPLSFAQERLWLVDRLAPGSAAYNIPVPLQFTGRLDTAALRASLAHVVLRHESLRTRFEERDGVPVQVIDPPGGFTLPLVDLTALPDAVREAESDRRIREEVRRPFDLRRGPVFRSLLVRLSAESHVLLSNMHHIVSDGWSTGVFGRETTLLYEAFSTGKGAGRSAADALPPLPIQYADFAVWQRRTVSGPALEKQLDFWRRQLAGLDPVLELPADRPRPARRTDRGGNQVAPLPAAVARRLQELSGEERTTIFATLLAGFCSFLHRQTGREDLCVGTPVAGRRKVETEGLIGFFVNTLVVRSTLAGDGVFPGSFRQHLGRIHEAVVDAQDHQDLPFDRLVLELAPERSPSHTPVFQVLFNLQSAPARAAERPAGLSVRPVAASTRTTKFDLTLGVTDAGGEPWLNLEHSVDLFDDSTGARMLGQLAALYAGAAADPDRALADLPLLSPSELHQILTEWGTGAAAPPSGACLHELFAAQVARTPDAVALLHGTQEVGRTTYAELADRAGSLARWLRGVGIGPEALVAVCLERSPDLIASLFGVFAAGGAYVPIDPAYPAERRALMLEDSGAAVLITRGELSAGLPATGARTLDLDREPVFEPGGGGLPSPAAAPGNLAYLIYTSGSTGRPKAVAIEHRSAVARVFWARDVFPAEELAGMLAATSVCFDLSVFEIFAPLAWGGRVILAENALELPSLPSASEVRLLNTVPSAAAELLRTGGLPPSVRTVNLAGEPLPGALAAALYATGTVERVLDLYGPSEDTTYSTGSQVPRGAAGSPDRPPAIGRPLPGTRAFVVDRCGRPVPAGVAGELWLAGAGLARGYLGRPELTAERFTPDPFSQAGERVYRTGDLVRFRPDGELEFLGRIDHQVKVRGFRIELGEVEAALVSHPAVEDCVCVVRDASLVAYLTGAPDLHELRAHLGRRLPIYMVPSTFVVLPALPRTPNGKVDRKALPAPERGARPAGALVAPRTRTEEILAEVWKELLGLEQAGVEDSFFALGGHSLLGMQALSRVRQAFGVDLPLRELFEHPTVAGLAGLIDDRVDRQSGAGGGAAPAPSVLAPVPRTGPLPLSFAQERLWLVDRLAPGSPAYNLPVALRFTGALDVPALRESLAAVVRRHESLRTRFEVRDGGPVQVIDPPGFALPLIELSALPPEAREAEGARLAAEEMLRPFDLERGPVFRSMLVRLAAGSHLLLSTMHHIVSDGWSLGVFARELSLLYAALSAGQPAILPRLPIQAADFAAWQRRTVSGPVLEQQIDSWRHQLAGLDPVLDLPADRPRPPVRSERGDSRSFAIAPPVLQSLEELRAREGTTLFTALLAAFFALLSRVTGRDDLCVGTPVAGRRQVETEGLIGFFVNTLVPRADLAGNPPFREHLARVHRTFLDAQENQDVPFDRLVLELAPERSLSYTPIFQVSFTLQNAPARPLVLPGLTVGMVEGSTQTSKFDLTLTMQAHGTDLFGSLTYATDLFDGSTVERLAGHFERLLTAAAAHPETPVRDLPLLAPAEEEQLIRRWNDTAAPVRTDRRLHQLIEAWAAETPDVPAVELPGTDALGFAELNRRANRLARRLLAAGAGPETRVALCMERHPDLIVGVLATLKAGAAFVVIDPAQPTARLALVLRDAAPAAVLTREPAASRLPELEIPVIRLDNDADLASQPDTDPGLPPPLDLPLDHPAYVIYTSGSTGVPKGVVIRHGAVLNLLAALEEAIYQGSGPGLRVSVNAPLYFDGAIKQIIQLAQGRTLCLVPEEARPDAAALGRFLAEQRVDAFDCTPAQLEALIANGWGEDGRPVPGRVLVGGEAISPALWDRLGRIRTTRFFNVYGPSECTVDTTVREIGPDAPRPVLGKPIANVRTHVLADLSTLQPVGVPGELCVGGAGLARGYLGRLELTAERFVPDPFAVEPGARLYRTGDLARRLPEGELEFLGRIDHQVKVRGFRIELGEIEAALREHPAVRSSVVLARDDSRGARLLAAYVAGAPAAPPDPAALRAFLGERLPAYMVPAAFVVLDALPLTRNGKVDRKALPTPDRAAAGAAGGAQPGVPGPRDLLELEMVRLWEEVLGVRPVGIRDDFFALGGHSLLAVQLTARLGRHLGREIPLAALLGHPTVEALASVLRRQEPEGAQPLRRTPLVELAAGSGRPLFLVHPIGGEILAYVHLARLLAAPPAGGRAIYGLQVPDREEPWQTIEEMATGYLRSIREVQPEGPYTLGGWSMGGVVAFEMARQLESAGEGVDLVALIDSFAPDGRRVQAAGIELLASFAFDLASALGVDLTAIAGLLPPDLAELETGEALERIAEVAGRIGLLPVGLDAAELARRFTVFAAGHRALERYVPGPCRAPLVLFRATERPAGAPPPAPDLGWGRLATELPVVVHELPGDHYTLLREPAVEGLALRLRAHLKGADQTPPPLQDQPLREGRS